MLNEKGFKRPTYEDIVEQTEQIAKQIFGEDIETSEQTVFGKFIRVVCNIHSELYKELEYAYYARFPNTASGINLDRLCPFAGITRNPATYAEHKIKVFGTQNAEIEEIKVSGENNDISFHNIMPFSINRSTLGKNLFRFNASGTYESEGWQCTVEENGSTITTKGTDSLGTNTICLPSSIELGKGTYTLSCDSELEAIYLSNADTGVEIATHCIKGEPKTFTLEQKTTVSLDIVTPTPWDNESDSTINVQLEVGDTATEFEPFVDPSSVEEEPEYYAEIEVQCDSLGAIGNVNKIDTVVEQLADVTRIEYVKPIEIAEDVEDDFTLRKRFAEAIAGSGSSNENAIRAALMRVPTVMSAGIIVNDTEETVDDRPPHSFECFVYGGEDYEEQIAEMIFEKKPIGIKTVGNVTKEVFDDGGKKHEIKFSHTQNVPIYINIRYKKNSSFENDGEYQIIDAIATYINGLGIGADVVLSSLYGYIYSVKGVADVTSIELSTDGTTYNASNIVVGDWQVAMTGASQIKLEVI